MKRTIILLFTLMSVTFISAQSNLELRLIPQLSYGDNNTIQRPNNSDGTRVYLNKEFSRKDKSKFSPRIELEYTIKRNHIVATAAFVKDEFEGISPKEIKYNGLTFNEGANVETDYIFNTYRLTYRYGFINTSTFDFQFGGTLLFRDAFVRMKDNTQNTKYSNFGIAPLLSYYISYNFSHNLKLYSFGDGFAVNQGSAFDIFAGLNVDLSDKLSTSFGYRLLDGGADVDKFYNKATFHFLAANLNIKF